MMPLSRTNLVGIALTAGGIALYGTWAIWLATRTNRPVDDPISMAIGHVRTRDFKVNLNALYTIDIEVLKKIPFDTLNCLLGLGMSFTSSALQECPNRPSVVKATWTLSSDGQTVANGSSDDARLGSWGNDSISRILGSFHGENGRRYVLDVDVLADGSSLALGNPRLKVEVHPMFYEDVMVGGAAVSLTALVLVLIGGILLVISSVKNRHTRNVSVPPS
jgi:hypothetical protein